MKHSRFTAVLLFMIFAASTFLCACSTEQATLPTPIAAPTPSASVSADAASPSLAAQTPAASPEQTADAPLETTEHGELSVWLTYWQAEDYKEQLTAILPAMGSISFFAAYFNEDGSLYIPHDERIALFDAADVLCPTLPRYLTIVNDVRLSGGGSLLKDDGIIRSLLSDDAAMNAHIDEIVSSVDALGFDGVDLDYESIFGDASLMTSYVRFIEKLSAKLNEQGAHLRVILEPAALTATQYPSGAEYIVMCYNLHGGHSTTAGAKADFDFMKKLAQDASALPGEPIFAVANGGYDFMEGGDAKQLTDTAAKELAASKGVMTMRDPVSYALWFSYYDASGVKHTVYYADAKTLIAWVDTARSCGISRFALWRLGGCDAYELSVLADEFEAS